MSFPCSIQYSLVSIEEGAEGDLGGLFSRRDPTVQLYGGRPAAHIAVSPSIHQRFTETDSGGVRLQADLLLPVSQPGRSGKDT